MSLPHTSMINSPHQPENPDAVQAQILEAKKQLHPDKHIRDLEEEVHGRCRDAFNVPNHHL